jgi:hypothetical protein
MEIPKDPNAQLAFKQLCKYAAKDYGREWDELSDRDKKAVEDGLKCSRLRAFMEQGEAKTHDQAGTFICEIGYAFKNIVDQCEHYRIYRCDGGYHFAVVFIEHKEREGSSGKEIKYVVKNGELVPAMDIGRNHDALELD